MWRRFHPTERALATSIAVQSNGFGWAVGTLIPAVVTTSVADRDGVSSDRRFELAQAALVSCTRQGHTWCTPAPCNFHKMHC